MPTIRVPTELGQYTNTDHWANGQPERIYNVLIDESGGLTARPGLKLEATVSSTAGAAGVTNPAVIGMFPYRDAVIVVSENRRVSKLEEDGTLSDLGGVYVPGWDPPRFLVTGGTGTNSGSLLIFGGGPIVAVGPQNLTPRYFASNLSPNAATGTILEDRLVVNDGGSQTLRFSRTNEHAFFSDDLTNDDSASIEAYSDPDTVLHLATINNQMFVFGENSIEVFYDSRETTGNPYARLDTPPFGGCGAGRSVLKSDNTLWYFDDRRRLIRLEGFTPQAKSLAVEAQLRSISRFSDVVTHLIEIDGHHLILCHWELEGLTLVYDYVRNLWSQWAVATAEPIDNPDGWTRFPARAYCYHPDWNKHLVGGLVDGKIFELSTSTYQDDSAALVCDWKGPYLDGGAGMHAQLAKRLRVLADGGTASTTQEAGCITAFADYSGSVAGTVSATSTSHGLSTGDVLVIGGSELYDGTYEVTVINANSFYFTATWDSDPGVGNWKKSLLQTDDPPLSVRWRNESREWQEWREISLGAEGEVGLVREVYPLTTFRRLQLHLRFSANAALRIGGLELDLDPRTR